MTRRYDYAIALGQDSSSLAYIEDLISVAPTSQAVPVGSVTRKTMDGATQVNGAKIARWQFAALSNADFYTISQYFGAAVTVNTRTGVNAAGVSVYTAYNGYTDIPLPGDGFEYVAGGVADLTIDIHLTAELGSLLLLETRDSLLLESGGYLLLG